MKTIMDTSKRVKVGYFDFIKPCLKSCKDNITIQHHDEVLVTMRYEHKYNNVTIYVS